MTKSKNTKHALLMSVLSMMLCCAMLVGSTFAWFTDSVTSGANKIVAGNLDIELNYQNASMTSFEEVKATTDDLFVTKEGTDILWEPGAAAVTYLELKNAGTLALKYQLSVNSNDTVVGNDGAALSKVLKTAVVEIDKAKVGTYTRETATAAAEAAEAESVLTYIKPGDMKNQGDTLYLAMIVYFPKEIENTYDGALYNRSDVVLKTELSLSLIATQTSHEQDSFGDDYDANVKFPAIVSSPVTADKPVVIQTDNADYGVKLTADAGAFSDTVKDVTLTVEDGVLPAAIKITDAHESKVYEISLKDQDGNKVTAADGKLFTVEISVDSGLNGVSVYHEGTLMHDDGETLIDAADHYVYNKETGIVTMKVNSFSPFTVLYSNGKYEEISFGLYKVTGQNNAYAVANADGFVALNEALAAQKYDVASITLLNDIDMTGKTWTPVDLHADKKVRSLSLIDGKGHTISNLNINGRAMFLRFAGSAALITIKDLTFDAATVNYGSLITAIVAGECYQNVLFDNVDVKNSAITGTYKVAPYIGQLYDERPNNGVTATFKNCDVSETVVTGTAYDFCISGMVAFVYEEDGEKVAFENCTVKDVTLKAPSTGYNAVAAVYCNDGSAKGSINEIEGVTVTNVNVE